MRINRTIKGDRKVGDILLGFEWEGGPYIQVCKGSAFSKPYEVIHVGEFREFTMENFRRKVDNWIIDYGTDNLIHDVVENWKYY